MTKVFIPNQHTHSPCPSPGLSLGWRLSLSTVLIISLVMGGISIGQHFFELKNKRLMHENLLEISLAPLAVQIEAAMDIDTIKNEVEKFHKAYIQKGYPIHELVLRDASNEIVLSTLVSTNENNDVKFLQAMMPIVSPLLNGGKGGLMVLKNDEEYQNAARDHWLLWIAHYAVTVGVVFLFLSVAIYFQVTKPVKQLVHVVRKMEMGYWKPINLTGGAWEIRWLAWRFGNMILETQSAMTHLFEAEQKSRTLMTRNEIGSKLIVHEEPLKSGITASNYTGAPEYRELIDLCERLEMTHPDDLQAAQLGRTVWQKQAVEANRLGFHKVKARLEDAALHLMEPEAYRNLDKRLSQLKESWREWAVNCSNDLYQLLEERAIPCAEVMHRVKHTAGVWAKMQSKGLSLDEINDLYAFRIIVPTEADCYAVLSVIHHYYKPVVMRFKDYIASPKENGYRSIHTCVVAQDGPVFEVQIRTVVMDRQAEGGNAAHWIYKKGGHNIVRKTVMKRWWRTLWRFVDEYAR